MGWVSTGRVTENGLRDNSGGVHKGDTFCLLIKVRSSTLKYDTYLHAALPTKNQWRFQDLNLEGHYSSFFHFSSFPFLSASFLSPTIFSPAVPIEQLC